MTRRVRKNCVSAAEMPIPVHVTVVSKDLIELGEHSHYISAGNVKPQCISLQCGTVMISL